MKRRYELKERAKRQAETRRRIVEAAVELHTTVGPAHTTVSAVAERASVQRHTVYAHFPDEASLFAACSAHWRQANPFPDPAAWGGIEPPAARLARALADVYGWYEDVEAPLAVLLRDASLNPLHGRLMEEDDRALEEVACLLARDRPRRKTVRAAIGHALEFETWRSLVRREGLTSAQAVDVMVRLVDSV